MTRKKQNNPKQPPEPKGDLSPGDVADAAEEEDVTELGDDTLEQVSGGEPPGPVNIRSLSLRSPWARCVPASATTQAVLLDFH